LDAAVAILLGANDHGKTNFLEALLHLNSDEAFEIGRDPGMVQTLSAL